MNVAFALALVAFVLQCVTAVAMFVISRAPGWERARLFGLIAVSAALYAGVDMWAVAMPLPSDALGWVIRLNLTNAGLHASAWLLYTFADERARLRDLPRWVRLVAIGNLAVISVLALSGLAVADGPAVRMRVESLGIDYTQPNLSLLGNLGAAIGLTTLCVSWVTWIRRAWAGVPGALGLAIGFTLFSVCAIEEALVTAGVVHFIFLADLGYIFVVVPVTLQLMGRFTDDARRWSIASSALAVEVKTRTEERDAARDALIEQERLAALGRLAAGVGHEISNPLQYLSFSLEELREDSHGARSAEADETLARAFEGVSRIRRVVDGLRSYARPTGAQFVSADVHHIVQAAMRVASPQLRRVASIELDLQPVPCVFGDEGQLVQMIVNPLVNAAQALRDATERASLDEPSGRIRVVTRTTSDGYVEITIADNGPGFPADVLPRLGEPYVTTKLTEGGTGLGVFVTQGLVQAHKGTLFMQNASEGGAVVRITLPSCDCVGADITSHPTRVDSIGVVARRHVLLVDDEPLVLGAIARGLVRAGYHVTLAADGAEALQLLRTQPFDAVVSDLMMPRLTGMELAEILAAEHPQTRRRFIAMTGGAVSAAAEAFVADPRAPVLYKPIDLSQLIESIEAVVA